MQQHDDLEAMVKDDEIEAMVKAFEGFEDGDVPSRRNCHNSVLSCVMRCSIFLIGITIGLIFLFPNMMMSDSGTARATLACTLGIWASLLFIGGGIVGGIRNRWNALLPGLVCQLLSFAVFLI